MNRFIPVSVFAALISVFAPLSHADTAHFEPGLLVIQGHGGMQNESSIEIFVALSGGGGKPSVSMSQNRNDQQAEVYTTEGGLITVSYARHSGVTGARVEITLGSGTSASFGADGVVLLEGRAAKQLFNAMVRAQFAQVPTTTVTTVHGDLVRCSVSSLNFVKPSCEFSRVAF